MLFFGNIRWLRLVIEIPRWTILNQRNVPEESASTLSSYKMTWSNCASTYRARDSNKLPFTPSQQHSAQSHTLFGSQFLGSGQVLSGRGFPWKFYFGSPKRVYVSGTIFRIRKMQGRFITSITLTNKSTPVQYPPFLSLWQNSTVLLKPIFLRLLVKPRPLQRPKSLLRK